MWIGYDLVLIQWKYSQNKIKFLLSSEWKNKWE